MITSAATILYPNVPGIAPGTVLPAGAPGLSAYQLAVAQGFVGSVADWLASLAGPPGPAPSAAALAAAIAAVLQGANPMPNTPAALQSLFIAMLGGLPTSPVGLAPGALYLNGGVPSLAQP